MIAPSSESRRLLRGWIPFSATLLMLIALVPMPYGYYTFLRFSFCMGCVYYVLKVRRRDGDGHRIALGGLAVLYNPILPVHLGNKSLWTIVNVGTVLYFWARHTAGQRRERPQAADQGDDADGA